MNHNSPSSPCRDLLPKAVFKRDPVDFQVVEKLGFEPDGAGEHVWLQIRKTGWNTQDVVDALARELGVQPRDVGVSGLKDKQAITTQWISAVYPIVRGLPDVADLFTGLDGVEVLQLTRGTRKLRRGVHRENEFIIQLHDIESSHDLVDAGLERIKKRGFPNYFGAQRFGRDGRNVDEARSMFTRKRKLSRFKRSMYLSAARSLLFNRVLEARIEADNWLQVIAGDVCMLSGTNSVFKCETPDAEVQQRHDQHDIHITGPLYGMGQPMTTTAALALENTCMASEPVLCTGLEKAGLKAERRALRALCGNLQWQWSESSSLTLSFSLQRGAYATAMLAELFQLQQEYRS